MHAKWVAVLALSIAALATGCSQSSTVELQKPGTGAPPAQTPDAKPGEQGGNSGNTDNDGDSNDPSPNQPSTPAPAPGPARYRVLCEAKDSGTFASSLTEAHGVGGFFTLFLGHFSDPNQAVTRDNFNLRLGRRAMLVPGGNRDHITVFFAGRKELSPGRFAGERFYMSDVDLLMRTGRAVDLGSVPSIGSGAASAAEALGLPASNYGASDSGQFVLLPGSGGLVVTNRDRTKTFGTLKVDTSRTLFPRILEKEKLFVAMVADGSGLRPLIQSLEITPTRVSALKTLSLGGSGSAGLVSRFDDQSLAWSEVGSDSVTIAKLNLKTFNVERATYRSSVSGASIFPQVGFVNDGSKTIIYVAIEKARSRGLVEFAKLQMLSWGAKGALVDEGAADYPASVITRVQSQGRQGRFIIQSMLTSPFAEEVIATFDDHYGEELYKARGDYLDLVIENPCVHPVLVEEAP